MLGNNHNVIMLYFIYILKSLTLYILEVTLVTHNGFLVLFLNTSHETCIFAFY